MRPLLQYVGETIFKIVSPTYCNNGLMALLRLIADAEELEEHWYQCHNLVTYIYISQICDTLEQRMCTAAHPRFRYLSLFSPRGDYPFVFDYYKGKKERKLMLPEEKLIFHNAIEEGPSNWGKLFKPCSICAGHIWFRPFKLYEPEDAPLPRHSWVLCKHCHRAFVHELDRANLITPVRIRVAVGLVAAERSPHVNGARQLKREFS